MSRLHRPYHHGKANGNDFGGPPRPPSARRRFFHIEEDNKERGARTDGFRESERSEKDLLRDIERHRLKRDPCSLQTEMMSE